jgi:hypothetical protein
MIAAWMLFALEISALLFVAAWIAERSLLLSRRPVRGIWVAAIAGANLLPILLSQLVLPSGFARKLALAIAPESTLTRMGMPLLVLWGVAATVGALVCASALWRMSRARPSWKDEHVDNTPVLVSHDVGPALVGVLHYSIVVPQWAHSLESGARKLLLAHEREHARHYDPLLLAVGVLAVVVAPWNAFNWLMLRRLHLAVELDCDQRVLRAHPDAHGYGVLLLDVAERVLPSVLPAAAFVEHGASIEKRIDAMSAKSGTMTSLRTVAGLSASVLLVAAACFTPRPYAIVIVNPPAPTVATLQTPASAPAAFTVSPKGEIAPRDVKREPTDRERTANASLNAVVDSATRLVRRMQEMERVERLRPVAPSPRTVALDIADKRRIQALVAKEAPRALDNFPRADSGLLMLLDRNDRVLKKMSVSLSNITRPGEAMSVFASTFAMQDVNGIESATEHEIDRDADDRLLRVPLRLFTAQMIPAVPTARTREEAVPTREVMITNASERSEHSVFDSGTHGFVSIQVYNLSGKLLQVTTVVDNDSLDHTRTNGTARAFARRVLSQTAKSILDQGALFESGVVDVAGERGRGMGLNRIVYGVVQTQPDIESFVKLVGNSKRNWESGSSSSRTKGVFNPDLIKAKLRLVVHTRVPDAYGEWARADSGLIILLDANDDLVEVAAAPIPKNHSLTSLADFISLRLLSYPAEDINQVGFNSRIASESGRLLDKPLEIVWGRLSTEATRQRLLKQTRR